VKKVEDVRIEFGPQQRNLFNEWLAASFENGLIKTRVEPLRE
jgi:hypothetical protein